MAEKLFLVFVCFTVLVLLPVDQPGGGRVSLPVPGIEIGQVGHALPALERAAQHALLAKVGDSYRLKDLQSTNGTQVNDVPITDAELKDGDKIRFGAVVAAGDFDLAFAAPLAID